MSCLCGLFQGLRLKEMLCSFCLFCFVFLAKYPVLARGWICVARNMRVIRGSLFLPSPWSQQNSSRCCFQLETQKWLHMNVYMQTISVSVCVHMYTYVHIFILCLYSRANTYMHSKWWVLFLPSSSLACLSVVCFVSLHFDYFSIQSFSKRVAIKFYGLSLSSSVAFFVFTFWTMIRQSWLKQTENKQTKRSQQSGLLMSLKLELK